MTSLSGLSSCVIIERDINAHVLVTWSYPDVDPDAEVVLKARSRLASSSRVGGTKRGAADGGEEAAAADDAGEDGEGGAVGAGEVPGEELSSFSKYKGLWVHMVTVPLGGGGGGEGGAAAPPHRLSPKLTHVAVALMSEAFHPEKYLALCKLLTTLYTTSGTPLSSLQCFLSVFAKGNWADDALSMSFKGDSFDIRHAYLTSSLKAIIGMFGEEIILLWVALMIKKRVGVFCSDLQKLLHTIRGFPLLVWHRQSWNTNLWPYIAGHENEISDIQSSGFYTVGFTNPGIKNNTDLFDLIVDLDAESISVVQQSRDSFMLSGFHKEMTNWLVESSGRDDMTDQALIKELTLRTKKLLEKLESLKETDDSGSGYVTMESIHKAKIKSPLDHFMYNLAIAEEMALPTDGTSGAAATEDS